MIKKSLVFFLGVVFLIVGCTNSSSSSNSSISGNVADGYLIGATVCIDENLSLTCDEGESTTTTGEDGYYSFEGVTQSDYPIVVEVTSDTIDSDTNEVVDEAYTLSTNSSKGGFISPITTLINEYYLANANSELTIEEVRTLVATQLGLESTDDLFTDYMLTNEQNEELSDEEIVARRALKDELHSIAKLLVYTKQELHDVIQTNLEQSSESYTTEETTEDEELAEQSDSMNLLCNEHLVKNLGSLRHKAKNMHWGHEDEYKAEGETIASSLEISEDSMSEAIAKVRDFKNRRKNHTVSGYVSTGSISITSEDSTQTNDTTETSNSTLE